MEVNLVTSVGQSLPSAGSGQWKLLIFRESSHKPTEEILANRKTNFPVVCPCALLTIVAKLSLTETISS
jgi:hypothetical protein